MTIVAVAVHELGLAVAADARATIKSPGASIYDDETEKVKRFGDYIVGFMGRGALHDPLRYQPYLREGERWVRALPDTDGLSAVERENCLSKVGYIISRDLAREAMDFQQPGQFSEFDATVTRVVDAALARNQEMASDWGYTPFHDEDEDRLWIVTGGYDPQGVARAVVHRFFPTEGRIGHEIQHSLTAPSRVLVGFGPQEWEILAAWLRQDERTVSDFRSLVQYAVGAVEAGIDLLAHLPDPPAGPVTCVALGSKGQRFPP